ncbi:tRNA (adenine(37)-N6)-methyltransferase [Discoglossus pictus]
MPRNSEKEERAGLITSSLETGHIFTTPIGYIESCFTAKNGTPRQPSVCSLSRGCIKISKNVFNNPDHSLMGLEQFSHVWILFVFHKNGHLSCKAKVQPPRLNGAKTGVFSTRSPHRPNAIGLTLARLEKVEGGTIYLSGIDIIHGTPVLDIKPYIAEYDAPQAVDVEELKEKENHHELAMSKREKETEQPQILSVQPSTETMLILDGETSADTCKVVSIQKETQKAQEQRGAVEIIDGLPAPALKDLFTLKNDASIETAEDLTKSEQRSESRSQKVTSLNGNIDSIKKNDNSANSFVASWVTDAPVASLKVRFTPNSEMELKRFKGPSDSGGPSFRFFQSPEEAKCAITTVLSADPRSVYRRKQCLDRLFYFSLDIIHITCWFGDGFVEVVQIKPLEGITECES